MTKTKESLFDINKLPNDGYIVLPLSMSRLSPKKGQSPEEIIEIIKFFEKKINQVGIDFIILYTNGLYYNDDEPALAVRKKTNHEMIEHKNKVLKLINKGKKYIPQAAHFIPWDYIVLNCPQYQEYYQKLLELKKKDATFKKYLEEGLNGRAPTEANINFFIEEIVVTHLIRQRLIEFPKTLVKQDKFRLIVYPGSFLNADLYQWKKRVLPQTDKGNPYQGSQYDFSKKIIYNFDSMELN
jgi:hypothetical protein